MKGRTELSSPPDDDGTDGVHPAATGRAGMFHRMLRVWISDQQMESRSTADEIQREVSRLRDQQDRLLNLRLPDEIEPETFARKDTELRDRSSPSPCDWNQRTAAATNVEKWRSRCLNPCKA